MLNELKTVFLFSTFIRGQVFRTGMKDDGRPQGLEAGWKRGDAFDSADCMLEVGDTHDQQL